MSIYLRVNGNIRKVDADPGTPLLWVLRDDLKLKGTKYGCGIGQCGACTVHLDGQPTRSCSIAAEDAVDMAIVTIEGLSRLDNHPVQRAWLDHAVPQCGYCQSGMIMAVAALLAENAKPTDRDIDTAITNICRCGTYHRIRGAIHAIAGSKDG